MPVLTTQSLKGRIASLLQLTGLTANAGTRLAGLVRTLPGMACSIILLQQHEYDSLADKQRDAYYFILG